MFVRCDPLAYKGRKRKIKTIASMKSFNFPAFNFAQVTVFSIFLHVDMLLLTMMVNGQGCFSSKLVAVACMVAAGRV